MPGDLAPTVCFADLVQGSDMITFESVLTTFIANVILEARYFIVLLFLKKFKEYMVGGGQR
jgi:hypothetical protein